MTEQPAAAQAPAGRQPAPPPSPQDRVAALRAQLAEAEAALPPVPGTARVRVMPPHDSFTVGGVTVGAAPTAVPAAALTRLMSAAADAGVTIKEVPGA
jgi:hypothetical protein